MLLAAAGAILGGVVVVAMGRGGQIADFRRDIPVLAVRFRTPDEVALARLPLGLFGYQAQATGDALAAAAALVDERDAEIAELRRELSRFGAEPMVAGSVATGSAAGGSAVTGPAVTGPVVTGPVVTGPVVTGPVVTGSGGAGPGAGASGAGAGTSGDEGDLGGAEGDEAVADPDAGIAAEPRWRQ